MVTCAPFQGLSRTHYMSIETRYINELESNIRSFPASHILQYARQFEAKQGISVNFKEAKAMDCLCRINPIQFAVLEDLQEQRKAQAEDQTQDQLPPIAGTDAHANTLPDDPLDAEIVASHVKSELEIKNQLHQMEAEIASAPWTEALPLEEEHRSAVTDEQQQGIDEISLLASSIAGIQLDSEASENPDQAAPRVQSLSDDHDAPNSAIIPESLGETILVAEVITDDSGMTGEESDENSESLEEQAELKEKKKVKKKRKRVKNSDEIELKKLEELDPNSLTFVDWLRLKAKNSEVYGLSKNKKTKKQNQENYQNSLDAEYIEILDKSIDLSDEVASETLADLMAQQGYYDKALEMYKQLSLKSPDKSAYFAPKIDLIKNKLNKK